MNRKSPIIKFPDNRLDSSTSRHEHGNESDVFEEWEIPDELQEKEDYPALVKYCQQRAERFSDDPYAQYYLEEAYVLNGEYEKAIEFRSGHHRRQPWNPDYHGVILDALYALGKTEDDFEWVEKPVILRMSAEIVDACYEFLRSKRKPRSVEELYTRFVMKGYLLFTEEDLLKALSEDSRFVIKEAEAGIFAEVRVAGNRRTRRR